MTELVLLSNGLGAALFAVLALVLAFKRRGGHVSALLVASCVVSAAWFAMQLAYYLGAPRLSLAAIGAAEVLRDAAWFACLFAMLAIGVPAAQRARAWLAPALVSGVCLAQLALAAGGAEALVPLRRRFGIDADPGLVGFLLLGVVGLVLVENLYRRTRADQRWSIRPFCFGVGGLFAYDIFLYSHAVLFNEIVPALWNVRGAINAVGVPLIALSVVRTPHWKADLFISRQVVFHSTAVLLVGAYLLVMAGAGYYIRVYGGTWGSALQALFFFGALLLLVMLMASSQLRAQVRVFLAKHFYRNKYEYREEWLHFTRTLAEAEGERAALEQTIVRAIASIMDCRWGYLWRRHEAEVFVPVAEWQTGSLPEDAEEPAASALVRFLETRAWIVDLDEYHADPSLYGHVALPPWLRAMTNAWLIVPLAHQERLIGFIVLARSLANRRLDWEDRDLLKTVAQQSASYLALLDATDSLMQARQFEAYNRLSAFVVHDLKNLAAQLALIEANAGRHRDNPEFIADAFATVENAVAKLNRVVASLRAGRGEGGAIGRVALDGLLEQVVAERRLAPPAPSLRLEAREASVLGDRAQLLKAIAHLVQNAQEATPAHGSVQVRLSGGDGQALIEVSDNGCGMDPSFIREHLFRPFDTTKGNAGMGIGVFEARQIVQACGGDLGVTSTPGRGTVFTIRLPIAQRERLEESGRTVAGEA